MGLSILAIDDDAEFLIFLKTSLHKTHNVLTAQNLKEARLILDSNAVELVLLDISLGDQSGLNFVRTIKTRHPGTDVIMVTGEKNPRFAMDAVKMGAIDYLVKPFTADELTAVLEKITPYRVLREKNEALLADLNKKSAEPMLGNAAQFEEVITSASRIKTFDANILIEGESGTGKELMARYLNKLGGKSRPFIAVNCAAIPENLLESELFGHEKGSFTDAHERKLGKFELAHGGDLFLDEVSTMKRDLQAKMLRALQSMEICRVGGNVATKVDVRVLAATNENLEGLVEKGEFRRDLFHRLRVVYLKMPPLRQRREDIPALAAAFLKKFSPDQEWRFSPSAMRALQDYAWPGNIRELENLVHSLVIMTDGPEIGSTDLPEWVFRKRGNNHSLDAMNQLKNFLSHGDLDALLPLRDYVVQMERAYIGRALELTRGDKTKAAKLLQISRTSLYERIEEGEEDGGWNKN